MIYVGDALFFKKVHNFQPHGRKILNDFFGLLQLQLENKRTYSCDMLQEFIATLEARDQRFGSKRGLK